MSISEWSSYVQGAVCSGTQYGIESVRSFASSVMASPALPDTRLDGKVAIITGANSGIGKETAKELAKRGAKVIIACRDEAKGKAVAEELSSLGRVVFRKLDLASFKSVKEFCTRIKKEEKTIDILVNNAGVFTTEKTITEDGNEIQFQVNYLSHFLLTLMLIDLIKNSKDGKIINVSSAAHWMSFGIPSDIKWENTSYNGVLAYAHTKLANIMFSNELALRLKGSPIGVYSLHPGAVATSLGRNIPNYMPEKVSKMVSTAVGYVIKTPEQGAKTTLYCCLSTNLPSGYYDNMKEAWSNIIARQEDLCKELWTLSEEVTKFKANI